MENDILTEEQGAKFSDFGLEPELLDSISKLGYEKCTPIQAQAIPLILEKKDVAGLAQTGTGKTAAFLVPLMDRILKAQKDLSALPEEEVKKVTDRAFKDWQKNEFVLVLVPTRELAEQVLKNVEDLGTSLGLRGVSVYGGTGYEKQKKLISEGVEFVVATPGRLIDLFKDHSVDLRQVRAIVFDEADRMFDMGFKDDMDFVLRRIPRNRQYLVFSATLNFDVLNTAYKFEAEPVEINLGKDVATAENVEDFVLHVGGDDKPSHLLSVLKKYNPKQTIIFSNYKANVERIAQFLNENGYSAVGISSLLNQTQRNRVMEQFRAKGEDSNILVATDVAARGLDVENVDLVVNYDLPSDAESYVHRIGRTGRASAKGKAFSLSGHEDVDSMMRIEEYIKRKIEVIWLDDSELIKDHKPFPRGGGYNFKPVSRDRGSSAKGGSRPKKDGPPRRSGTKPRPKGEHGSAKPGEERTHRDKRRGRHKDQSATAGSPQQEAGAAPSRPKKRRSRPTPKTATGTAQANGSRRTNSSSRRPGKPQSARVQAPQQQGLGQKVSSFFKKLFG